MASLRDFRRQEPTRSLPERVGQLYYSHGLFCSSHPVPVIVFAITVVLLCCYPLLNLPMPGNVPQQLLGNLTVQGSNVSETIMPQWFVGPPMVYIQQVIVKTAVCPWTKDLMLTDAFRAPLSEVFKLLEVIQNYQHENSSKSLSHLCLHVEAVKSKCDQKLQLPEYNCLVLSPANLWQQNRELFHDDPNLLSTIFSYQNLQRGKISLAEMLFGMNMKDTGIKRYPLRTRQRVLQFAVTIVFKKYDLQFVMGLKEKLTKLFPLHQPINMISQFNLNSNGTSSSIDTTGMQEVLHIYYPGEFNISELFPLAVTYFMLFLYVYFNVRKIELVKSKVGMAFSAVVTALASLFMSVGLCFFFGLTLSLNGRDLFPYLIVIVGLENVLVLTKSVVSTPAHLDVKIRIAQGLSREGWSITKNLLTEVTILTVGLFTFVPAIQKFCIFAVVGLISDFFLQMFFFSTVLAIDIHRMELSSDSHHHRIHYVLPPCSPLQSSSARHLRSSQSPESSYKSLQRSKSHPRLNGLNVGPSPSLNYPTNVVASPHGSSPMLVKLPKRLRLVHFWARTRIFQRTFMIFMVIWISFIVYSSGVVEQLLQVNPNSVVSGKVSSVVGPEISLALHGNNSLRNDSTKDVYQNSIEPTIIVEKNTLKPFEMLIDSSHQDKSFKLDSLTKSNKSGADTIMDDLNRLKHSGFDPWRRLSHHHWPAILSLYNISVAGQYITILPSIRLSLAVTPDIAQSLRNLEEHKVQHFQWQTLAAALDPLDFSDGENTKIPSQKTFLGSDVPFIPTSPMEIFFTAVLCIISVVVLAYTMVVLYRCVCSRNYAEWRTSWAGENEDSRDGITQVVMEAVPLVLDGHQQDVECLTTDGTVVVSSCLGGSLCIWDSFSGDKLAVVDRKRFFSVFQKSTLDHTEVKLDEFSFSDYESGSPPSHGESSSEDIAQRSRQLFWDFPDLRPSINTNFTSRTLQENCNISQDHLRKRGYFYGRKYEDLYHEFRQPLVVDHQETQIGFTVNEQPKFVSELKSDAVRNDSDCDSNSLRSTSIPISKQEKQDDEEYSVSKFHSKAFQNQCVNNNKVLSNTEFINCQCDQSASGSGQGCTCSKSRPCYDHHHFQEQELIKLENGETEEKQSDANDGGQCSLRSCDLCSSSKQLNSQCSDDSLMGKNVRSQCVSSSSSICRRTSNGVCVSPIWCLDCHENLVAVGCASGRIEFWEGSTGKFKCLYEDGSGVGVTAVKIIGNRVVAAKLSGAVDFFELESYSEGQPINWGFTYRRTHIRTNSAGALSDWESWAQERGVEDDIRCIRLNTTKAHQQPITVLDSEGGRVLTGSQDHTLKVFRLEDQLPLYTLHGHTGPVSCLFIDRISPMMSGSGSQDGLLCVWDLLTGACMYSIQAHDGCVVTLTYSASYVISLGADERLCVWERFQGHLLNTIQVTHAYCSSMVMLTHNLLITSKQGSLVVWDVRTGVPVRVVKLGHSDKCVFVKQILLLRDSVVCDYSNQLRIVRFPLVTDKCE